jgi:hypothetical protein
MSNTPIIPAFANNWTTNEKLLRKESLKESDEKIPDFWQVAALKKHEDSKYTITIVPTGAGKSIYAVFHAVERLKSPNTQVIIAVPQNQIGYGFRKHILDGGFIWDVDDEYFLSEQNASEANGALLEKFLKSDSNKLICSHATLVKNFDRIKEYLHTDCHIYVDEAHHSKIIAGEEDVFNKLGMVVSECVGRGVGIHLMTGTFLRGDTMSILSKELRDKFSVYKLEYDDYLKSRKSFNTFDFSFALAKFGMNGGYINAIGDIVGNKTNTAIFIPHRASNYAMADKVEEVCRVISQIIDREFVKEDLVEDKNGVLVVYSNRHKKKVKILDLVNDESDRKLKKQYIGDDATNKVDFIIALGMFREGANWTTCENAIICAPRNIVETLQIAGRTTRDLKGVARKHPHIYQIMAYNPLTGEEDVGELRAAINEYFTYVAASMLYEDYFNPIRFKKLFRSRTGKGDIDDNETGIDILDDDERIRVLDALLEIGVNSNSKEEFIEKANRYLIDAGIDITDNDIAEDFYTRNKNRTRLVLKEVSKLLPEIDMGVKENAFGHILQLTSIFGFNTFQRLREIVNFGEHASLEEHIKLKQERGYEKISDWDIDYRLKRIPANFYCYNQLKAIGWRDILFSPATVKLGLSEHESYKTAHKLYRAKDWGEHIKSNPNFPDNLYKYLPDAPFYKSLYSPKEKITVGEKYGRGLIVEEWMGEDKRGHNRKMVKCQCDCGKMFTTKYYSLKRGKTSSCGCYRSELTRERRLSKDWARETEVVKILKEKKILSEEDLQELGASRAVCYAIAKKHKIKLSKTENLIGKRYGKLLVKKQWMEDGESKSECVCDCGETWRGVTSRLKSKTTKSCGCLKHEIGDKISKPYKIICPKGNVLKGNNLSEFCKDKALSYSSLAKNVSQKRTQFHHRGYCLYHPKLVGTTHEERLEKGLYKKYIKLKK